VCTMCAPGDQRKSSSDQRPLAVLNALRFQPRAGVWRDERFEGVATNCKPHFATRTSRTNWRKAEIQEFLDVVRCWIISRTGR
jgi:hypothetical protein